MEKRFDNDQCRGYGELAETQDCHEFYLYLQTCDAELIAKINDWLNTKEEIE